MTIVDSDFPRGRWCLTDDIPIDFTVTPLFLSAVICAAVNPAGIRPPVWERWCRERSSRTQILQVGRTVLVTYKRNYYCLVFASAYQ